MNASHQFADTRARSLAFQKDIQDLLAQAVQSKGEATYCLVDKRKVSFGELAAGTQESIHRLTELGVQSGSRVGVLASNSIEHVQLIFALISLEAIWVPMNPRLRGLGLQHVLSDCRPDFVLIEGAKAAAAVTDALRSVAREPLARGHAFWTGSGSARAHLHEVAFSRSTPPPSVTRDTRAIIYTSGTTGPAKGVQVTDLMLRASALGSIEAAQPLPGDVLYVWEPLFHIGGAQVLFLPLITDASLALSEGFRVDRFWSEVKHSGATQVHYLGGILQQLLEMPPSRIERDHALRVGWGAGASRAMWGAVQERFKINLSECYGMTETSSIVTVNGTGPELGIGLPLPWFDISIGSPTSVDDGAGDGELLVRGRVPGLITPGYLGQDDATRNAREGTWWRTGDLVRKSRRDGIDFLGRLNDSVRRRGENVSAWEVETVFNRHPDISYSAMVGVPSDRGEQDIKLFVVLRDGHGIAEVELIRWASDKLANYQVPRYICMIDELPLTPSRRVEKGRLSRSVDGCFDTRRYSAEDTSSTKQE